MSKIINIDGFRCTNHSASKEIIASGVFDLMNPCTWCDNRKHVGEIGAAFHYIEFNTWEFPFIAETNCGNFSLIITDFSQKADHETWKKAKDMHDQMNRIAELGRRYSHHWFAYDIRGKGAATYEDVFQGRRVKYPGILSASDFFEEASQLRSDFFRMRNEIIDLTRNLKTRWKIHDSQLAKWLTAMTQQMGELTKQIDEIESQQHNSNFRIRSKWDLRNVTGKLGWEAAKFIRDTISKIIADMMSGKLG